MNDLMLLEKFRENQIKEDFNWLNPPGQFLFGPEHGELILYPDDKTDFWQRTHYGFKRNDGHVLYAEIDGDFVMTTEVSYAPVHQYDQAGLMVYFDQNCWLKTSVEGEIDEPFRLGSVVTNNGYSDWATQDYPEKEVHIGFRIERKGMDFTVYYQRPGDKWIQIRIAHLHLDGPGSAPLKCGLYACSPVQKGFHARFSYLKIESGVHTDS